ncbi:MAG TPA: hypothetical protein VFA33_22865 [Bryobacteraceae bacterium]|nr:hypothetical protein [Bryobacteraceae bacterium]
MKETRTSADESDRGLVVALYLPHLPNWLPLSSESNSQVNRNLDAVLSVAKRLYGHSFEPWLAGLDNVYSDKLRRCREASMVPFRSNTLTAHREQQAA